MNLNLNFDLASEYTSNSQRSRVVTENWIAENMYCPVCGASRLTHYSANRPVADFCCAVCESDFELKSGKSPLGSIIPDGAYATMIERITSLQNPNLLCMTHSNGEIDNLILIPKFFFTPAVIIKRRPLGENARRAGWVGCNINISQIPSIAKIPIIRQSHIVAPKMVIDAFKRAELLKFSDLGMRGWSMDVLLCIERLPGNTFTLNDIYAFAEELQRKHPHNTFINAKIRQQLQLLRDRGIIDFKSRGVYQKLI